MSEKDSGDAAPQNAQDLTVFVQSLLEQMVRITTQHVLAHCSVEGRIYRRLLSVLCFNCNPLTFVLLFFVFFDVVPSLRISNNRPKLLVVFYFHGTHSIHQSWQQSRFQQMSEAIIGRIDEMGTRIDDLEHSIGDLMQQAGIDEVEGEGQKTVEDQ